MVTLPPQDLTCPDPRHCPVPAGIGPVATTILPAGTTWYRVYSTTWGYDEFNPGFGDSRFAPFDAVDGSRVPTMYLGATEEAALVETIFHSVDAAGAATSRRLVYPKDLREVLLVHLSCPRDLCVADLRDPRLRAMNRSRNEVVTISSEHYPCTRRLAREIHARPEAVAGIVWHSRQAELLDRPPAEVVALFGDRALSGRGAWNLVGPGSRNLFEGPGRDLVERVAEQLGATVESGHADDVPAARSVGPI